MLIGARTVEGAGAVIVSPTALSIVSTTFAEGVERNRAMGIYWAIGGLGPDCRCARGRAPDRWSGMAVDLLHQRPGGGAGAVAPRLIEESRVDLGHRRFDVAGAMTGTAGLSLLVCVVVSTNTHHRGSSTTIGLLAGAVTLMAVFVAIEARGVGALMPLDFFRNRTVTAANVIGLLLGISIFAMFFFLSLYMKQVLRYSATEAGLGFLVIAVPMIFCSRCAGWAWVGVRVCGHRGASGRPRARRRPRVWIDQHLAASRRSDRHRRHLIGEPGNPLTATGSGMLARHRRRG